MNTIILLAVITDLIIGDPRWLPHPVIGMGKVISFGEVIIRKLTQTSKGLKMGGAILTIIVAGGTYLLFWWLLYLTFRINTILGMGLSIFWMSQTLAINSLYRHAIRVVVPLSKGELDQARNALAMIVGRDTGNLNEAEIIRGVVETVAENTVDGIISPLFYGFLGGPPLAMAYKAVNTLDSMIGYRDERYRDLGWAGARLDDLANFIPARLTGLIYLLIAPFTSGGIRGVWTILRRDSRKHPSPNSGIPEAAIAGALEIQLGGVNYYRGIASNRAIMGEATRPLAIKHVYHALYIMAVVSVLGIMFGMAIYSIIIRW
jgi:cobalamin biosynthesis protein CobD